MEIEPFSTIGFGINPIVLSLDTDGFTQTAHLSTILGEMV